MIVGCFFHGDQNDTLKWAQHDAYPAVLRHWFAESRRRYLYAERLVGVRTPLGERIEALESYDHRAVQPAHDLMAAYFRRDIYKAQRDLFAPSDPRPQAEMADQWWAFVRREVASLVEEPTVTTLLLEAVTRGSEPFGKGANQALRDALAARYRLLLPDTPP